MKVELLKTVSFSEHNERLYYEKLEDEKKEISRREFIKYLSIGSAGLLVPSYVNAGCPIPGKYGEVICLAINSLSLAKTAWEVLEDLFGNIFLTNATSAPIKDNINFSLYDKRMIAASGSSKYEVPPKSYQIYGYEIDGSEKTGKYNFSAKNRHSYKEVSGISVV